MSQIEEIRALIEARLQDFFQAKLDELMPEMEVVRPLIGLVQEFTLRPAKRIRPLMIYAGFIAVASESQSEADCAMALEAAITMELMQSYLLIQDDWMDEDALRRGQPSVHYGLQKQYVEHKANSVAILASDLAAAYAEELLAYANFEPDAVAAAMRAYSSMHQDVIFGQYLDVTGQSQIDLVHRLKTASYTIRGPLLIGAALGQANDPNKSALKDFGEALGLAFQLRDDLLGSFGHSKRTGKAADQDLRSGKRTALISEVLIRLNDVESQKVRAMLERGDLNAEEITKLRQAIQDSGARQAVEQRVKMLSARSMQILEESSLTNSGKALLGELVNLLVQRQS